MTTEERLEQIEDLLVRVIRSNINNAPYHGHSCRAYYERIRRKYYEKHAPNHIDFIKHDESEIHEDRVGS